MNIMNVKLTLRLNHTLIVRAKEYAKKHNTSLSKMIESFLDSITKPGNSDIEITPLVKNLSGIMPVVLSVDVFSTALIMLNHLTKMT